MRRKICYCDWCKNEIKGKAYHYGIKWESRYFNNVHGIELCKECAKKFHNTILGCEWNDKDMEF